MYFESLPRKCDLLLFWFVQFPHFRQRLRNIPLTCELYPNIYKCIFLKLIFRVREKERGREIETSMRDPACPIGD